MQNLRSFFYSLFAIPKNTNLSREVLAGLTTFFTMSYIVIVNPMIWGAPGTGISISGALTSTVLLAFFMTFLAGLFIKLPYAIAPGMGLNVFLVYSIIIADKIPWKIALGMVFWSGLIFLLISIFPIRQKIIEALPTNMKHALSCGIGLFLAFIGFKNLNLIVADPNTIVTLNKIDGKIFLGILGFLMTFFLFFRKKPYAFLFSIVSVSLLGIFFGYTKIPEHLFSFPDFKSTLFQVDILGALKWSLLPPIISILMTNLFDSISSLIALSNTANFVDKEGNPLRLKQALIVDSLSSTFASFLGTSPGTIFIESSTGIQAGGRTGLASIVTAFCFLPCLFIAPIVQMIPQFATAPILIFVGILMVQVIKNIRYESFDEIVPIFITIALMPLTFSITQGVVFGIVSYVITKILAGKIKNISFALWVISIVCFLSILLEKTNLLK